ncbi:hypothetical protein [Halomarina litorea]|uniref:hypothetical protein n=1 Tax=Halomarina litorea TaxID=2961595 RepID=UPI0020C4661C|nr:hypothetical protein [Halomarina sp. BCD28]
MPEEDLPSADEEVARLRLVFRRTDLSTFVERGFLVRDRDENGVRRGPRFHALTTLSESPDDHDRELPDDML